MNAPWGRGYIRSASSLHKGGKAETVAVVWEQGILSERYPC